MRRVAASLGSRKFRLTGGEPLEWADAVYVASGMGTILGMEAIGASTNGTRMDGLFVLQRVAIAAQPASHKLPRKLHPLPPDGGGGRAMLLD